MCQPCFIKMIPGSVSDAAEPEQKPALIKMEESAPMWELNGPPPAAGMAPLRSIVVDERLAKHLKPHQKEGVEFLWRNTFLDYNYTQEGNKKFSG